MVLEMVDIEDAIAKILKIEHISSYEFKEIEIDDLKTVYFIFKQNINIIKDTVQNASIEPIAFIYKINDEYYLFYLNNKKIQKKVIKEFVLKCLK